MNKKIFTIRAKDLVTVGTLHAAGNNTNGALGMGDKTMSYTGIIRSRVLPKTVKDISGGMYYGVILFNDGTIQTWGDNSSGQLGMGNTTNYNGAICTPSVSNVKEIACGGLGTLLLLNDGTVKAFGSNYYGQLLNITDPTYNGGWIVDLPFTNVKQVGLNDYTAIILLNDGTVRTYGTNDYKGLLGLGNNTSQPISIYTPSFTGVKEISTCGQNAFLSLNNNSTIKMFGSDDFGEWGVGYRIPWNSYYGTIETQSYTNFKKIWSLNRTSFIQYTNNTVYSCGYNSNGQMMVGSNFYTEYSWTSVPLSNIVDIRGGIGSHTLALLSDGTLRSSGYNDSGQLLTNNTNMTAGIKTPSLTNVKAFFASNGLSYAYTESTMYV